ncbi:hypothetical protein CR513_31255, partial [Mucuna pruriens]
MNPTIQELMTIVNELLKNEEVSRQGKTEWGTLRTQMLISGRNDVVRCKMFVGTLGSTTFDWFSGLPNGTIIDFEGFSKLFLGQFAMNKTKSLVIVNLLGVDQRTDETLKNYLTQFMGVSVRILVWIFSKDFE